MKHVVVMKFGGSSVGSPHRFKKVIDIIRKQAGDPGEVIVVASALSGVTDKLVALCGDSPSRDARAASKDWIFSRHRLHAAEVLSLRSQRRYDVFLQHFLEKHEALIEEKSNRARNDALLAMGERLSINLLSLALEDIGLKSSPKDAADLIATDANFGDAGVDVVTTGRNTRRWYADYELGSIPVVTGFIGCTPNGQTSTLGRGGSDYSASLLTAAVGALRLERWTDVDGLYTHDPRRDERAVRYDEILLEEAVDWNRAGKLGMHSKALDPLVKARIPVFVRSIDHPDWPGTVIRPQCHKLAATG